MRTGPALGVALAAALQAALAGCAPSWPDVRAMGDARFLGRQGDVVTIDLLPVNLRIATDGESGQSAEDIAASFEQTANGAIQAELARRGYRLNAVIDWRGQYTLPNGEPGLALAQDDLMQVEASLESFGSAQARSPHRLLAPYLPVRLGSTGSDATLFVGGYGFSGEDHEGVTADDVGKVVLVAVFVVAIVAILVVASKSGGGGGGKHLASGGGGGAAGHVASHMGGMGGAMHHAGNLASHVRWHPGPSASEAVTDAFGRIIVDTHLSFGDEESPALPMHGDSQMLVEMTLIDNRTGQTLWHAREVFPANPARTDHVNRVFGKMLGTMPTRTP